MVLNKCTEYEYDEHHNVIVQTDYSSDGKSSTYTYQHIYDEKWQILTSISESTGNTFEYTYDDYGNCINSIIRDAEGNITTTLISRYDYFYTPNAP